jgi:tetratricopeptide (TPR) repeat protein
MGALRHSVSILALLIGIGVGGALSPASAQTTEENWQSCNTSAQSPDAGVAACTALLEGSPALPSDARFDALVNRAIGHYAAARYKESIADNTAALALRSHSAIAYANRADGHYSLGDYSAAALDYTSAIEIDPNLTSARQWRGNSYFAMQRYPDAIRDFDVALAKNPGEPFMLYDRGRSKALLGNYADALVDYDASAAKDATRPFLHYDRGVSLHNLRRYEEADKAYQTALKLDGTIVDAMSGRAGVRLDQGDNAGAEELYRQAVAIDGKSAFAMTGLGNALLRQDKTGEAIEWYSKVIDLGNPSGWAFADRSRAYLIDARIDQAMADAEAALKIDSSVADAYYLRGLGNRLLGANAASTADLDTAIQMAPGSIWHLSARAELLVRDGELVKARPFFDRMISVSEADLASGTLDEKGTADSKAFLGWAKAMTGEATEGRTLIEEAAKQPQARDTAFYFKGVLDYLDGDNEAALASFGAAVEATTSNYSKAENLFERGRVNERLGRKDAAAADYAAALKIMPRFAEASAALKQIDPSAASATRVVDAAVIASIGFRFDSADLGPDQKRQLRRAARQIERAIADGKRVFVIEGWADASGKDTHNLELSQRRAEAVQAFLINEAKIKAESLRIEARGEIGNGANRGKRRVVIRPADA